MDGEAQPRVESVPANWATVPAVDVNPRVVLANELGNGREVLAHAAKVDLFAVERVSLQEPVCRTGYLPLNS